MAESILIVPTTDRDWDRWDAEARRIAGRHYAGRVALLVETKGE